MKVFSEWLPDLADVSVNEWFWQDAWHDPKIQMDLSGLSSDIFLNLFHLDFYKVQSLFLALMGWIHIGPFPWKVV